MGRLRLVGWLCRVEVWVDFFVLWIFFCFRFCFGEMDFASLILLKIQIQTLEVIEIFGADCRIQNEKDPMST